MSTSKHEIIDLSGQVLGWTYFDRPLNDLGAPWAWVCSRIADAFDCSEDEIGCQEPDEDDAHGDDYVTVNGKPVARYVVHMASPAENAAHVLAEFLQAAE